MVIDNDDDDDKVEGGNVVVTDERVTKGLRLPFYSADAASVPTKSFLG